MDLDAFGQQTFAAFAAAAVDDGTSVFGGHAGAEAELAFAGALRRLVSAFAHGKGRVRGARESCGPKLRGENVTRTGELSNAGGLCVFSRIQRVFSLTRIVPFAKILVPVFPLAGLALTSFSHLP